MLYSRRETQRKEGNNLPNLRPEPLCLAGNITSGVLDHTNAGGRTAKKDENQGGTCTPSARLRNTLTPIFLSRRREGSVGLLGVADASAVRGSRACRSKTTTSSRRNNEFNENPAIERYDCA
ncbi:hypothetical protein ACVMIH_007801 [Bradyrhizobium sp. USDA 4503]